MSSVPQNPLRGSFIYLANAVGDLRGQWRVLAAVLAPLVLLTALCFLPDALNLQHALAQQFIPGARHVGYFFAQDPYTPSAAASRPLIPSWAVLTLDLVGLLGALGGHLLVLCLIRRRRSGSTDPQIANEALATWREALKITPAFFWVGLLQFGFPFLALALWRAEVVVDSWRLALLVDIFELAMLILGGLLVLWLFFAEYALVFDEKHSFHALLFSRDLMRKRFFRVATRIVVFSAVWSGYESWAAALFAIVSRVVGPVSFLTGYFWSCFFIVELAAVAVTYMLGAFFVFAGARLYRDLVVSAEATPMTSPKELPTALTSA
ncbi:MAG TPA: hypothetical protein VFB15_01620 [Candidatus Binataceae bacterium]|nr:hypothetical protein [Candidatus Binataceae bacterium]